MATLSVRTSFNLETRVQPPDMPKMQECTTSTTVNGNRVVFTHGPADSALEVLREQAGLTGAKLVCGAGVCGACTVRLDGKTVTACILPATALNGRLVETVEKHGADNLHAVQKAFLAHDGLQCGFCTPGFINEAITFYEQWCSEKEKGQSPSREQIAEAMAGHLCRCGSYVGIYEAVRSACAGEFDDVDTFTYPRLEGIQKVTGAAKYTVDISHDNQLTARLCCSSRAHAVIKSIDTSTALGMEGVKAIVEVLDDEHRTVRYVGQPILAVAAISDAIARNAVEAIKIEYEARGFVLNADDAEQSDAPEVYPEKKKKPPNASEGPIPPGDWNGNVRTPWLNKTLSKNKRAVTQALHAARDGGTESMMVEYEFRTQAQTHTAFEPHCCVACWDTPDTLTVHTSTQSVFVLANEIAKHFNLDRNKVSVNAEFIGGAFGAKAGLRVEHLAAIKLAREAGAPVRLVLDRLEEMTIGGCRPATRIKFGLVSDSKHQQAGMRCEAWGDCGIAVQSQVSPWVRYTYTGPKHCEDFDVTTNTGPAKPMRAPSGPAAFWAMESCVDAVANQLNVDPIKLRRQWEGSDVRDKLYDWVESIPQWRNRKAAGTSSGRYQHGMGFAIGNWFNAFHNGTRIELMCSPQGIVAQCAVQDMGQGARSVMGKAVADELGVSAHDIDVQIGRSDYVQGPISSASRSTASLYPVALEVAGTLKKRLLEQAEQQLELKGVQWQDGGVIHDNGHMPLQDLIRELPSFNVMSDRRGGNGTLDLVGSMPTGDIGLSMLFRMTGAVSLVSVNVDTRLGKIQPDKVWMGMSVGKIANPALADSQIHGAVAQSLGYALTEERTHDPLTGALLSMGLDEYRIPGMGDIPEIEIHYDETGFDKMRGGACGLAEISTLPLMPALGNAVFNATGWRPTDLPMCPRRVSSQFKQGV